MTEKVPIFHYIKVLVTLAGEIDRIVIQQKNKGLQNMSAVGDASHTPWRPNKGLKRVQKFKQKLNTLMSIRYCTGKQHMKHTMFNFMRIHVN
jgi:hypothetical protein